MVDVEDLARDLSLRYREGDSGVIHLQRSPDNVIFVHESRNAHINGERVSMDMPCMRRGTGYILARPDADLIVRTLKRYRDDRVEVEPIIEPLPVLRPAEGFPREWRPRARDHSWRAIVVHHMASGSGSAAVIHRMHRQKGWDGLGYHFVIGNGTLTPDGSVELGYRWTHQKVGAHCRAARNGDGNWWNREAIGICLVGNFTAEAPSADQMESLVRLVRALRAEYGIAASEVRPHRGIKKTACPGREFPWADFQRRVR